MNKVSSLPLLWNRFQHKTAFVAAVVLLLIWQIRFITFEAQIIEPDPFPNKSGNHIQERIATAQNAYIQLLERQSKSLGAARTEYQRRYQRNPPDKFDEWYNYAVKHNSLIIDDFDSIEESLRPFRAYYRRGCALDLQEQKKGTFLKEVRLMQVCVRDGKLHLAGDQYIEIVDGLKSMIKTFIDKLPEICFHMNMADEPRSLLPFDTTEQDAEGEGFCPSISFIRYEKQNWWSEAVLSCPPDSPARRFPGRPEPPWDGKLLDDFKSTTELCSHTTPVEHGVLTSPDTLYQCHNVVPILSNAGLSTSSDVLFPSMYRYYSTREYNATTDIPWAQKAPKAYWRGSTTGGHNFPHGYERMQRHRLVAYANSEDSPIKKYTDVGFTKLVQCEEEVCKEMKEHFKIEENHKAFATVWQSKIAIDIDGNGLSGRFYPLLRSNSAVFRQSSKYKHPS